jgi:hypothetical protein
LLQEDLIWAIPRGSFRLTGDDAADGINAPGSR